MLIVIILLVNNNNISKFNVVIYNYHHWYKSVYFSDLVSQQVVVSASVYILLIFPGFFTCIW